MESLGSPLRFFVSDLARWYWSGCVLRLTYSPALPVNRIYPSLAFFPESSAFILRLPSKISSVFP